MEFLGLAPSSACFCFVLRPTERPVSYVTPTPSRSRIPECGHGAWRVARRGRSFFFFFGLAGLFRGSRPLFAHGVKLRSSARRKIPCWQHFPWVCTFEKMYQRNERVLWVQSSEALEHRRSLWDGAPFPVLLSRKTAIRCAALFSLPIIGLRRSFIRAFGL
jgi:hypothetical protein